MDAFSHKRENELLIGTNSRILHFIADNKDRPVYLRDIEHHFGISRSSASKNVDFLVRGGFLKRHAEEIDARLRRLTLTPKAESLLDTIREDCALYENELLKGFTPNEVQTLLGYLNRMKENIETACSTGQAEKKEGLS